MVMVHGTVYLPWKNAASKNPIPLIIDRIFCVNNGTVKTYVCVFIKASEPKNYIIHIISVILKNFSFVICEFTSAYRDLSIWPTLGRKNDTFVK